MSFSDWMVVKEKEESRMTFGFVPWATGCVVVAAWRQETWVGGAGWSNNKEMNFRYSFEFWEKEVRQCVWLYFDQLEALNKLSISV